MENNNDEEKIDLSSDLENTLYRTKDFNDIIRLSNEMNQKQSNKKISSNKQGENKTVRIVIITLGVIIILILVVLIAITLLDKNKEENEVTADEEEIVVVTKDNYRYENGVLTLISDGNDLGTYNCTVQDQNKCLVASFTNETNLDVVKYYYQDGTEYHEVVGIYNDSYAFITDDNKINLYDIKNSKIIDSYDSVKKVNAFLVITVKDGKYGLISLEGLYKVVLENKYDFLGTYDTEKLVYEADDLYGLMTLEGKKTVDNLANPIKSYNDKYVAVKDGNSYILYDYNGKKTSYSGSFIGLDNDYITIYKKGLYVYDSKLNLLNVEPIEISDTNYVATSELNSNGKVISTKVAYTIEPVNGKVRVSYGDNYKLLNPYEGIINATLDYVSYSDGKLYFYSDKDKTKLIGSYTCENQNDVTSENDKYTNCMLAEQSKIISTNASGYIPIYDEKYVFINDTASLNTGLNIVFYDLVNKSQISSSSVYSAVDTGYSSSKIEQLSTSNLKVYAKKSNETYGVFTINAESTKGLIAFNKYTNISLYNNKYYILSTQNASTVYDLNGNELITTTYQIDSLTDKYAIVKDGSKLSIYENAKDGKVLSSSFDKIDLEDYYYIGINNNKLNLYLYNATKGVMCNAIDFENSYSYTVKYYNAKTFDITILDSSKNVIDTYKYNDGTISSSAGESVCSED